jgi:endonuclease G
MVHRGVVLRAASAALLLTFGFTINSALARDCGDLLPYGAPESRSGPSEHTRSVCHARETDGLGFLKVGYDRRHAGPLWAAYHLSRSKMLAVEALGLPRDDYFREDAGVEVGGWDSPNHGDYTGVGELGLARGHLAPSKAMSWDPQAQDATYTTANIVPQHSGFNGGAWAKLEGNVRAWACNLGTLFVVTGVIYGDDGRPPLPWDDGTDIDVPTHFYKVIYTPGRGRAAAFLFDNADMPARAAAIRRGLVAIDEIEARAAIDLMPELTERAAERLESRRADPAYWPLGADSTFACTQDTLATVVQQ